MQGKAEITNSVIVTNVKYTCFYFELKEIKISCFILSLYIPFIAIFEFVCMRQLT